VDNKGAPTRFGTVVDKQNDHQDDKAVQEKDSSKLSDCNDTPKGGLERPMLATYAGVVAHGKQEAVIGVKEKFSGTPKTKSGVGSVWGAAVKSAVAQGAKHIFGRCVPSSEGKHLYWSQRFGSFLCGEGIGKVDGAAKDSKALKGIMDKSASFLESEQCSILHLTRAAYLSNRTDQEMRALRMSI